MAPVAFVTGATGCVGLNLVELLLREGWRVAALVRGGERSSSAGAPFLRAIKDAAPKGSLGVFAGDICDAEALRAAVPEGVDCVFHVAGDTSLWRGGDARQRRTNCEGTRAVCVAAVAAGARRVVLTSSIAALGRREGRVDDATTSDAEGSNVAYQVTKRQSELIAKQVLELSATPLVVLRPGAVFGPFDIHTWSRTFVAVAAGKVNFAPPGEASFVHAEEVAKAHLAAAIAPVEKVAGRSFLLAGRNCTYAELFRELHLALGTGREDKLRVAPAALIAVKAVLGELVADLCTKRPPLISWPAGAYYVCRQISCDCSQAEEVLGLRVRPLREMVQDSFRWLKESGVFEAKLAEMR